MAGSFKKKLKTQKDQQAEQKDEGQQPGIRTTEVVDTFLPHESTESNSLSVIATGALQPEGQIVRVRLDEVYAEEQVRPDADFDQEFIGSLKETFSGIGILQPPRVFPKDKRGYRIWLGENRVRSARAKGDEFIDVYVGKPPKDDKDRIVGQLVENIKHSALKPVATALAFKDLKDNFKMKGADIAKEVGVTTAFVSKHMKLLDAPEKILDLLRKQVTADLDLIYTLCQVNEISEESADKLIALGQDGQLTRNAAKFELDALKGRAEAKNKREKDRLEAELRQREEEEQRREEEEQRRVEGEQRRIKEEESARLQGQQQTNDGSLKNGSEPDNSDSNDSVPDADGNQTETHAGNNAGNNNDQNDRNGINTDSNLTTDIDFNSPTTDKIKKKVVRVEIDGVIGYLVLGDEVIINTEMGQITTPSEDIVLLDVAEIEL